MAEIKIFGYTNKISVKQGESIDFHVNADGTDVADAQLVRLIHGDEHIDGPGFVEEEIDHAINGVWNVKKQFTQLGSYLTVDDPDNQLSVEGDLSLFCYIWPTMPAKGLRQTLIGRWDARTNEGYGIGINPQGYLEFWVGDGNEVDYVVSELPLQEKVWYFVGASFNKSSGQATLHQYGVLNRYNSLIGKVAPYDFESHVQTTFRFKQHNKKGVPFLIAGAYDFHELRGNFVNDMFYGKIDRPGICNRVLSRNEMDVIRSGENPPKDSILAYWDTTAGYSENGIGNTVTDIGSNQLHAQGVNHPVRCLTGWNWSGKNDCFRLAPEEFGGVEFHPESVTDCNWEVTKSIQIPTDLRSGVYAMRLKAGNGIGLGEEYIVFLYDLPNLNLNYVFWCQRQATWHMRMKN